MMPTTMEGGAEWGRGVEGGSWGEGGVGEEGAAPAGAPKMKAAVLLHVFRSIRFRAVIILS